MSAGVGPVGDRCELVRLPRFTDTRGSLVVGELGAGLPFVVERFFVVTDAPEGTERGGHANRHTHELLVALRGRVTVEVDDGRGSHTVVLDDATLGLHLQPLVWSTQRLDDDAVMLVLASTRFSANDSIDDRTQVRRKPGDA